MKIKTTDAEIVKVQEALDLNKNGFVDYQEFALAFNQKRIDKLAIPGNTLLTVIPTKDMLQYSQQMCATQGDFYRSKSKEPEYQLTASSRFSATPFMKNTFMNFRANQNEVDYSRGLNSNIDFQKKDKLARQVITEKRIQLKRDNQKILSEKIEESNLRKTIYDTQKVQVHTIRINEYEKACKTQMEL
jgi:hypothetical protein